MTDSSCDVLLVQVPDAGSENKKSMCLRQTQVGSIFFQLLRINNLECRIKLVCAGYIKSSTLDLQRLLLVSSSLQCFISRIVKGLWREVFN